MAYDELIGLPFHLHLNIELGIWVVRHSWFWIHLGQLHCPGKLSAIAAAVG